MAHKQRGIIRHIDELGRLAVPKEFRIDLGLMEKDAVQIIKTAQGVWIKKAGFSDNVMEELHSIEQKLRKEDSSNIILGHVEGIKNILALGKKNK